MFEFNSKTYVNRVFKKTELSKILQLTTEIRQEMKIIEQVALEQVLASATMNMASTEGCQEIYIFGIRMKEEEVPIQLIEALDQVTTLHTYFRIYYRSQIKELCIYRTIQGEKIKRHKTYETAWLVNSQEILPYCNQLEEVYQALVKTLIPLPAKEGESVEELIDRYQKVHKLAKQIKSLEQKITREKQPKKKFEIGRQLRELQEDFKQIQGD